MITRPLLQEIYQNNPWKMLTCCIMLNLTNRRQVDGVRKILFKKYPTAKHMMKADEMELALLLKPLGLYNRRAKTLIRFSKEYMRGFNDVGKLYGIGRYAMDSWEIFQNDNTQIEPTDKVLLQYLEQEGKTI